MKDAGGRAPAEGPRRLRRRGRPTDDAPAAPAQPVVAEDAASADDGDVEPGAGSAFYLFGVLRAGGRRGVRLIDSPADLVRIRFRDLEALARSAPFSVVRLDDDSLQAHQRAVETAMRACTILPMPFGVVFRGRRALIGFLQDQYLTLDEGLSFLDGYWELRLHLNVEHGDRTPELNDMATHIYSELRRGARAALPLRHQAGDLYGAAFLVERDGWIRFVERADDLVHTHADLGFDVTGPWPPYDFVRLVR